MIHTKFQASEPDAYEEEGFEFFMYFYASKLGPPLGSGDLCLKRNFVQDQQTMPIPNFKHLSQVYLKKKFSEYCYVFLLFEPLTPYRRAILNPVSFI